MDHVDGDASADVRRGSAPPEVWDRVRADYLAGISAPVCCRRWGVGLTALRDRAAKEGWRRADQPWTPPNRLEPDDEGVQLDIRVDGDIDRVELRELTHVAANRMLRAVLRGQAADALRWRRVRDMMLEEEAELERIIAQEEAVRFHLGLDRKPDGPDGSDGSDGVFPRPAPDAPALPDAGIAVSTSPGTVQADGNGSAATAL